MIVKCSYCGKEIEKTNSQIKTSKSKNFFCNNSCAASFNNSKRTRTEESKNNISNIKCPVLVMHGEKDGVVSKSIGEWTYSNLVCEDKEIMIYPNLYHEIFNEFNKDKVIKDLLEWLEGRVRKL